MAEEISIRQQVKAQLLAHLLKRARRYHARKAGNVRGVPRGKIGAGSRHDILVQLLNLDDARSIKIPQSAFGYEMRDGQWILLVLYMNDMEPFYLPEGQTQL